ncbi:MAG: hypothetical protein ACE5E7_19045 [Anaerolineae bacterium]
MTLNKMRREFEASANRSISMPIAGAIVWFTVALLSTQVGEQMSALILLFGSGTIFPIALLVAKLRNEALITAVNPLAKLLGLSILMVNLLWAVHIPLFLTSPELVLLSIGIGLGLHWIVYSWIVQHPIGTIHAILRTLLVLGCWTIFPGQRLLAMGLAIVFVYCFSIWRMLIRPLPE